MNQHAPGWRPRTAVLAITLFAAALPAGDAFARAGDLDPSFGDGGHQVLAANGHAEATLVQPDGRIVVVSGHPAPDFVLRRLMPNGEPDPGFDGDGTAIADLGGTDHPHAAALQPDGSIVAVGNSTGADGVDRAVVARLTPGGKLDPSFSPGGPEGDGRATLSPMARAWGVLVQGDGRVVVAGDAYGSWVVTRLTATGAPDGTVYEPVDFGAPGVEFISAIAPLAGGGFVVAGSTQPSGAPSRGVMAAFGADGKLLPLFGQGGKVAFTPEELVRAEDVRPRAGGGVVVAGSADPADPRIHVLALDAKGVIDREFGTAGVAAVDFVGQDTLGAAIPDAQGRILVAGTAGVAEAATATRLTPAGDPDPAFGTAGRVSYPFGLKTVSASAALQPGGALVITGETLVNAATVRTGVTRLLGDPPPVPGAGDPGSGPGPGPGTDPGAGPGPGGDPVTVAPMCGGRAATIVGTAKGETLRGTPGADVIFARGGHDKVLGAGGADRICGGGGRDALAGGAGRDRLDGGGARDRCRGGAGRDRARRCER